MSVLKKKSVAVMFTIFAVVASLAIFGGGDLRAIKAKAEDFFISGEEGNALILGVEYDLNERTAHAKNLTAFAKQYLPEDDKLIANVLSCCDKLGSAKGAKAKFKANEALGQACEELNSFLYSNYTISGKYGNPEFFLSELDSDNSRMKDSAAKYNQMADEFNTLISTFPTSVVKLLSFTGKLERFE